MEQQNKSSKTPEIIPKKSAQAGASIAFKKLHCCYQQRSTPPV
jgi:hypothetical protein